MRGYDKWKTSPPAETSPCDLCRGRGEVYRIYGEDGCYEDCPECDGGRATQAEVQFQAYVDAAEDEGIPAGRHMFTNERFHPAVDAQFFADVMEWR